MRVERDEKSYGREKVSGCCLSSATTRALFYDFTTALDRRVCRNRVQYDRVRRLRTGSIACALCRDEQIQNEITRLVSVTSARRQEETHITYTAKGPRRQDKGNIV